MWTTIDEWNVQHESWFNGSFDDVDPTKVEELVERAQKTMALVLRNFRDKEVPGILKICESIKTDVVDFNVQVPIIQALRTDGMKKRHWELMTKALGFELV